MSNNSDQNALKPSQAIAALKGAAASGRSLFLWGAPGIGKSDIVRQVADYFTEWDAAGDMIPGKECLVYDVRLLLLDPIDLRGMPYRDVATNRMVWSENTLLPPEWIMDKNNLHVLDENGDKQPNMDHSILFLDELTAAPPSIQAAAYQLVLDRKVGEYNLPANCKVVAAGNRTSDKGVAYKMPTPLANRFVHISMKVDKDDWLEWAIENAVHPDVVGFISQFGGKLHNFNPTSKDSERSFPTPRSWTFVSDLTKTQAKMNMSASVYNSLVAGSIGSGVGVEFVNWRKSHQGLPNVQDILSGKVSKTTDLSMSAKYYIVSALTYEMNELWLAAKGDAKKRDALAKTEANNLIEFILNSLNPELQIMAVRILIKNYSIQIKPKNSARFKEFLEKNTSAIVSAVQR